MAFIVISSESIDSTSAASKMVFRMLTVLAEFERDVIAERTRTAMLDCAKVQRSRINRPGF